MASPEEHALLSASGSHRWLSCPPSVRLSESIPSKSSTFAEEGRVAHSYSEFILGKFLGKVSGSPPSSIIENAYFNEEMKAAVGEYTDRVKEEFNAAYAMDKDATLLLEQQYQYDDYVPDGFGTSDVTIITKNKLIVIDLKYGKGVPVEAEDNPQIRLYALGAYQSFGLLYDFDEVEMHIMQPRLESYTYEKLSLGELLSWGESIKPIARVAYDGGGEFKSGEHCRWCPVKATCRHRYNENIELAKYEFSNPDLLTEAEIGSILEKVKHLESWSKDIQEYAFEQAKKGKDIPGWKLVAGRKSRAIDRRKVDEYKKELRLMYTNDELTESSFKSMSKIEKMVGKKDFSDLFGDYLIIQEGKPTLVKEDDKRPGISGVQSAIEDFL